MILAGVIVHLNAAIIEEVTDVSNHRHHREVIHLFPHFLYCFSEPFTMVIVFYDPRLRVGSAVEHRAGEPKVECSRGTGQIRFFSAKPKIMMC